MQPPQINSQTTGYGYDGLFALSTGRARAFGQDSQPLFNWRIIGLEPRKLSGQAHSTNAVRNRGLPCLVTLPGMRLLPLVRSPGHSPV
jgi:hypothetical protein